MARRGADANLNGYVCGTTRNKKSPSALAENHTRYIGMVLAPKSLYPCAVFVESETAYASMVLMTPNRKYVIGAGYFGSIGRSAEDCRRQHMLPGLCRTEDLKQGFGAALYIGGVMVVQAALDNRLGNIPSGYLPGAPCTYSYEGSREPPSDAAWANLHTFKLARFGDDPIRIQGEDAEPTRFSFEVDADNFFDVYDLDRQIMDNEGNWESMKAEAANRLDVDEDDVYDVELGSDVRGVTGSVTVSGYYIDPETGKEVFADILDFAAAAGSGLILHLGPDFDRADIISDVMVPIPADTLGKIDWSQTPLRMAREAILQQAEAWAEDGSGEDASSYLEAAEDSLWRGGWSSVANDLRETISGVSDDGEEQMSIAFNPAAKAQKRHKKLARDWDSAYGPNTDWS